MNTKYMGPLVALMASIVFSSCVIDRTSGDLPEPDDDDADDDDSATGDDDTAAIVCDGSAVAYWTNWYRDSDGDGCLSPSEWDDHSDMYVAVASPPTTTLLTL